jgi:hypothetical protein
MIRIKDKEFVLKHNGLFIQKHQIEKSILSLADNPFTKLAQEKPVELHIPAKSFFKTKPTNPQHQEAWEDNSFITIYT